jgi:hypothetical protein
MTPPPKADDLRRGMNPMFLQQPPGYPPVMAVVITHLPEGQDLYHRERLPIIKTCIKSMMKFAGRDLPLMVWDNGSGPLLRNWLTGTLQPDWLILSPNIGKPPARASIMRMVPAETVVCVTDDDMLFYPGWLEAQLQILDTYPDVGAVSGWPIRYSFWVGGNENTIIWGRENATVETGQFIPPEEDADYAVSVGTDPASWLRWHPEIEETIITYQGVRAFASSQHCQMIAKAGKLAPLCKYEIDKKHGERGFDKAIDAAGLLRLTTEKRYTTHMGNILDDKTKSEIQRLGL